MKIETDPKASAQAGSTHPTVDDESVIDNLITKLMDASAGFASGFKLAPIQVCARTCASNAVRCA